MFGWAEYKDFITAGKTSEKAHQKLEMLSREYGYTRTHLTLFMVRALLTGIQTHWWIMGACILFVVLFTITARGHIKKTQDAVNHYLPANGNESGDRNE
jgi:hypothetical protein